MEGRGYKWRRGGSKWSPWRVFRPVVAIQITFTSRIRIQVKNWIRNSILLESWIRIRIEVMRTRNPAIGNEDQICIVNNETV
jgi:hypothetical protein